MRQPETPKERNCIALITGASSGLGKAIARILAAGGDRVLLHARSAERSEGALQELVAATGNERIELLIADLASQAEVRRLAAQVAERTLAVNHLAPFLLTNLLLPRLRAAAPARIVNVGTRIDAAMDFADLNFARRPYRMMAVYAQSKLGNIHFTRALARRLAGSGVTLNCVFPGVFRSNLGGTDGAQGAALKLFARVFVWALTPPEKAAERVLYLLEAAEVADVSGEYFGNRRSIPMPAQARDPEANERRWRLSAALTGLASH